MELIIARIRGFRAIVNDVRQKPSAYFPDILTSFNPTNGTHAESVNPGIGTIIASQQAVTLLWTSAGAAANMITTVQRAIGFQVCYCSIYNECWVFSSKSGKLAGQEDDGCSEFVNDPKSTWWDC